MHKALIETSAHHRSQTIIILVLGNCRRIAYTTCIMFAQVAGTNHDLNKDIIHVCPLSESGSVWAYFERVPPVGLITDKMSAERK